MRGVTALGCTAHRLKIPDGKVLSDVLGEDSYQAFIIHEGDSVRTTLFNIVEAAFTIHCTPDGQTYFLLPKPLAGVGGRAYEIGSDELREWMTRTYREATGKTRGPGREAVHVVEQTLNGYAGFDSPRADWSVCAKSERLMDGLLGIACTVYWSKKEWGQILSPAGWSHLRQDSQGRNEWARPGQDSKSAATDFAEGGELTLFSNSEETGLFDLKIAGVALTKPRVAMRLLAQDDAEKMKHIIRNKIY